MDIQTTDISAIGKKLYVKNDGREVARAFLYILRNDLHAEPFGLMEDVFVEESDRGQGVGSELVRALIEAARNEGCYKLICTSRHSKPQVHQLYKGLGFANHGLEFRIDFTE